MNAGRELDALVAEKVFGCAVNRGLVVHGVRTPPRVEPQCGCPGGPHAIADPDYGHYALASYSTDIAAAWEVVKHFANFKAPTTHDAFEVLEAPHGQAHAHIYDTSCMGYVGPNGEDIPQAQPIEVWAATAPLAICLAALEAVGVDVRVGSGSARSIPHPINGPPPRDPDGPMWTTA